MKTKILLCVSFVALMLLGVQWSGCGSKNAKELNVVGKESAERMMEQTLATASESKDEAAPPTDKSGDNAKAKEEGNKSGGEKNAQVDVEKIPQKIVKTADISFKVEKYDVARTNILGIIQKHQGYVSAENQTGDVYRTTNVMVVRVGAAQFDGLIDELLKQAVFVDYKKINADDVTEEFVDVAARLKSKKDALLQYELILKKANSIDEILDVQQYISTLQEEIESMEGRLKYLNNKVDLSTVNMTFYEQSDMLPVQTESFGWKMKEALAWGWHGFLEFLVGMVYLWTLWLVMGITLFIILRMVKRGRKRRMQRNQAK